MRLQASLSIILAPVIALASQTPPEVNESSNPITHPYRSYFCRSGDEEKVNVVLNCLPLLLQLREAPVGVQGFEFELWQDRPNGCQVTASRNGPSYATINVRKVPQDLIFLIFRCFLSPRNRPAKSARIYGGSQLSYILELRPPPHDSIPDVVGGASVTRKPQPPSSVAASRAIASKDALTPAPNSTKLEARAPVICGTVTGRPTGLFTDCLPVLQTMLTEPGSGIPEAFEGSETQEWSAENCRIKVEAMFKGGPRDVFTVRSLIDDAVWMMGKCFAGPMAASQQRFAQTPVGPLRRWKLKMAWGSDPQNLRIALGSNSSVPASNITRAGTLVAASGLLGSISNS